jgi:hypothetical protein
MQETTFQEIMDVKSKKLRSTYHHLEEMKSLCNKDQRQKFDAVLNQIIPRLTGARDPAIRMKRSRE